jgi:hypothetical protein
VKDLDPDDPNDTAFKLVTICVFILCRKKLNNFFFREQDPPPPSPMSSLNPFLSPPPVPL